MTSPSKETGRVYFSGPFENCEDYSIVRDNPSGGDPIIIATIKCVHRKEDLLKMFRAVNAHDDLVKALRGFLLGCGADERALAEVVGEDVVRDAHEILSRIKTEG